MYPNLLTGFNIVVFTMLLVTLFLTYKMYQTPVNAKSVMVTIYLYVIVAMLFISLIGKHTETLKITDSDNIWRMAFVYFALAISGVCMMISDKMFVNHAGFLLLLLALSLIVGSLRKYSTNIIQATTITAVIVIMLTLAVYTSTEEQLNFMISWIPTLVYILVGVIIIDIASMVFFDYNDRFDKFMKFAVITLFCLFVLADTSKLLQYAKNTDCITHNCINYPLKSSKLILDYMNIFVRLVKRK